MKHHRQSLVQRAVLAASPPLITIALACSQLDPRQASVPPEPEPPSSIDAATVSLGDIEDASKDLHLSPQEIRRVQDELTRRGFDTGISDGIWGFESSQAMADFQRRLGLPPTGTLNKASVLALGLEPTES